MSTTATTPPTHRAHIRHDQILGVLVVDFCAFGEPERRTIGAAAARLGGWVGDGVCRVSVARGRELQAALRAAGAGYVVTHQAEATMALDDGTRAGAVR